jgi:hypothetical protein
MSGIRAHEGIIACLCGGDKFQCFRSARLDQAGMKQNIRRFRDSLFRGHEGRVGQSHVRRHAHDVLFAWGNDEEVVRRLGNTVGGIHQGNFHLLSGLNGEILHVVGELDLVRCNGDFESIIREAWMHGEGKEGYEGEWSKFHGRKGGEGAGNGESREMLRQAWH